MKSSTFGHISHSYRANAPEQLLQGKGKGKGRGKGKGPSFSPSLGAALPSPPVGEMRPGFTRQNGASSLSADPPVEPTRESGAALPSPRVGEMRPDFTRQNGASSLSAEAQVPLVMNTELVTHQNSIEAESAANILRDLQIIFGLKEDKVSLLKLAIDRVLQDQKAVYSNVEINSYRLPVPKLEPETKADDATDDHSADAETPDKPELARPTLAKGKSSYFSVDTDDAGDEETSQCPLEASTNDLYEKILRSKKAMKSVLQHGTRLVDRNLGPRRELDGLYQYWSTMLILDPTSASADAPLLISAKGGLNNISQELDKGAPYIEGSLPSNLGMLKKLDGTPDIIRSGKLNTAKKLENMLLFNALEEYQAKSPDDTNFTPTKINTLSFMDFGKRDEGLFLNQAQAAITALFDGAPSITRIVSFYKNPDQDPITLTLTIPRPTLENVPLSMSDVSTLTIARDYNKTEALVHVRDLKDKWKDNEDEILRHFSQLLKDAPDSSFEKVFDSIRSRIKNNVDGAAPPRSLDLMALDSLALTLTGKTLQEDTLTDPEDSGSELLLKFALADVLGQPFSISCKSGQDRTGTAFALRVAAKMFHKLTGDLFRPTDTNKPCDNILFKECFMYALDLFNEDPNALTRGSGSNLKPLNHPFVAGMYTEFTPEHRDSLFYQALVDVDQNYALYYAMKLESKSPVFPKGLQASDKVERAARYTQASVRRSGASFSQAFSRDSFRRSSSSESPQSQVHDKAAAESALEGGSESESER